MPFFFIIDKARNLYISEGKDKTKAIDAHNDTHKIKSDHAMVAVPCVHPNKFIAPELEDYMAVQMTFECQVCFRCSGETHVEVPVLTESHFYESKNEI